MRITIVASIAIETDGLTSASRVRLFFFFSGCFTSSRGPPERRLLGRTIRADCLRRMFAHHTSFIEISIEAGILRSGKGAIHASVGLRGA